MDKLPSEQLGGQPRNAGGLPQVAIAARAAMALRPWWRVLLAITLLAVTVLALWPGNNNPPSLFGWHVINHMVAFIVLTMLARAAFPALPRLWLAGLLLTYGALIEIVQAIPALQRTTSWADIAADAVGILIGLILVWIAGQLAGEPW